MSNYCSCAGGFSLTVSREALLEQMMTFRNIARSESLSLSQNAAISLVECSIIWGWLPSWLSEEFLRASYGLATMSCPYTECLLCGVYWIVVTGWSKTLLLSVIVWGLDVVTLRLVVVF